MTKLRVATTQFPVGADIGANLAFLRRQTAAAGRERADVILFPESALGGYPGVDFASFRGFDWSALAAARDEVCALARAHRLWVVLGSHHRPGGRGRPRNCLWVFDREGNVADRYDKRLLTGPRGAGELAHFRPGARPVVVEIEGVRCGLLICHEWRYPEAYRQYQARGVEVILQAWYDGGYSPRRAKAEGAEDLARVIPATVQGHAVANHLWICGANTSRRYSCFGGFVVRPDGTFLARQPRHRPGVLVRTIDTAQRIPDPAAHLRDRVRRGLLERLPEQAGN